MEGFERGLQGLMAGNLDFNEPLVFHRCDTNEACQTCAFAYNPKTWERIPNSCHCMVYADTEERSLIKPVDVSEHGAPCEFYEREGR